MRTLPQIFSQNDPAWQFKPLGNGQADLGQDGCLDVSFADCAVYFGKDTDPLRLDQAFQSAGIFVSGDLLADDALQKLYPDILYQGSDHYETIPADLGKLQALLNDPTLFVIVCIDMGSGNVHFSPVVDCDGSSKVTLANPWDGKVEDFSLNYGDPKKNILRFIVYKGTLPQQAPDYEALYNAKREECDTNWTDFSAICTALNVQADPNDKAGTVAKAQATIKSFSDQITQLQQANVGLGKTNSGLKIQCQQLNDENSKVSQMYQDKCDQDSTAIEEGLKAESSLKEITADMQSAASALDTTYPDIKNILTAIDALKTEAEASKQAQEQTVKQAQNIFQMFFSIFIKKK